MKGNRRYILQAGWKFGSYRIDLNKASAVTLNSASNLFRSFLQSLQW